MLKKILILYPHFPPSNLAGVHRPRLFAQHLPSFGWEPIILTVHEKYYEEPLDYNLTKLLPDNLRIEKVKAYKITNPRLIGDIGIRAFFQLYNKAKQLILSEHIDFLLIPIPSFYCALLGRLLNRSTKIKYGVDYIDPWVHKFPGSDKLFSRHWFSTKIAQLLEPIAVKRASLITGITEGYFKGVQDRNPKLTNSAIFGAMPYGGELQDHITLNNLNISPYLFTFNPNKIQLVYAGAFLPKSVELLKIIFKNISVNMELFKEVEFHFIGTGIIRNNQTINTIQPIAELEGIWQSIIFEHPNRIPYLDVLAHLNNADGIFVLGSTEPHYSPSKVYQGILSEKPIFAVLHKKSSAGAVLHLSNAGLLLSFDGEAGLHSVSTEFVPLFKSYLKLLRSFDKGKINKELFNPYSARAVTKELTNLLNKACNFN